jgi:hypothetical protein
MFLMARHKSIEDNQATAAEMNNAIPSEKWSSAKLYSRINCQTFQTPTNGCQLKGPNNSIV